MMAAMRMLSKTIISCYCNHFAINPSHSAWRRGGLMVSVLNPGVNGPGSGPGWEHCVVFLGKTLYSHGASLHPGI